MAQPTFPEKERTGLRLEIDEGLVVARRALSSRWRRHHQTEAWIFELQRAGAFRNGDVIGAADHALRMNVRRVNGAALHHVEPDGIDLQLSLAEIEVEGL